MVTEVRSCNRYRCVMQIAVNKWFDGGSREELGRRQSMKGGGGRTCIKRSRVKRAG